MYILLLNQYMKNIISPKVVLSVRVYRHIRKYLPKSFQTAKN